MEEVPEPGQSIFPEPGTEAGDDATQWKLLLVKLAAKPILGKRTILLAKFVWVQVQCDWGRPTTALCLTFA